MREISPALDMSADEFLNFACSSKARMIAKKIREQKSAGTRPLPSTSLIDRSGVLTSSIRRALLDSVARLVDENLFGRSEMCIQFALLLQRGLLALGVASEPVAGTAIYYANDKEVFRWNHCWVRIGSEVVDGNTDILHENPAVPKLGEIEPYWGSASALPNNRVLCEAKGAVVPNDSDVDDIWWPELRVSVRGLI